MGLWIRGYNLDQLDIVVIYMCPAVKGVGPQKSNQFIY